MPPAQSLRAHAALALLRIVAALLCLCNIAAAVLTLHFSSTNDPNALRNGKLWSILSMISSGVVIIWIGIYLILVACKVRVLYPVIIAFDLLSGLLGLAFSIGITLRTNLFSDQINLDCHKMLVFGQDCKIMHSWSKSAIALAVSCLIMLIVA